MEPRTPYDIYSCLHCGSVAAHGDKFCRGCGVHYSNQDIQVMKSNIRSPVGALPWNTRDRFRCIHCDRFVAITDNYCRGCGDEIEDHEKQLMRIRLTELAKNNTPSLIGLGAFVLFVIWASIQLVN